jgi:hypothetical protein
MQSTDPRYHGPSNWWEDNGIVYARDADTDELIENVISCSGGSSWGWCPCDRELSELDEQHRVLVTTNSCRVVMTEAGLYCKPKRKSTYKLCKPMGMHVVAMYHHKDSDVVELENGLYYLYEHYKFREWQQLIDYEPQINELAETYSVFMPSCMNSHASNGRYITSNDEHITIFKCLCRYYEEECDCGGSSTIIEGRIVDHNEELSYLLLEDGSVYDVFEEEVTARIQMHNRCRKPAC